MSHKKVFREDPSLTSYRSAWKTSVCIVLSLVSVGVAVFVFTNFVSLQVDANTTAGQSQIVRNQLYARLGPIGGLLLSAASALWFAHAAVFGCREWKRRDSGSRLRRKYHVSHAGGVPLMEELHRRFSTGDPSVYTPMPQANNRGDITAEAWVVPEDSVAYVFLYSGQGKRAQPTELLTFTGIRYDAFAAALKHRLIVPLPAELNPLFTGMPSEPVAEKVAPRVADTTAALTADAIDPQLQKWAAYIQGGGRHEEQADVAAITKARSFNTGVLLVSGVVLVGGAIALLALSTFEQARTSLLVTLALFLGLLAVAFVPRIALLRRNLGNAAGLEAVVSAAGIQLRGLPFIAWSELLGAVYLDDRRRTERALAVPVIGWGLGLAFKAGEGSIGLTIAVRDGVTLRSRLTPPAKPSAVKLWPQNDQGLRGGSVTMPLDVRLAPDARERFIAAVRGGAITAQVPFYMAHGVMDNTTFLGRMLDPKWGDEV